MFRLACRGGVVPFRRAFSVATDEFGIVDPKLLGLCSSGRVHEAFTLVNSLDSPQSPSTYAVLFRACARWNLLYLGEDLHRRVLLRYPNCVPNIYMDNHLINLYAKCGKLEKAHQVFDKMPERNIVSWTALISGYAKQGKSIECFSIFSDMLSHHRPTEFAYSSVIASCGVESGRQVHAHALKTCFVPNLFVSNALIIMYSNSPGLEAWSVFTDMDLRNLVSWNSMITCLRDQGHWIEAVTLFSHLRLISIRFDHATIIGVVSALSISVGGDDHNRLQYCFQLHCLTIKTSFDSKIEISTALVKAFSDLGGDIAHFYGIFLNTNGVRDIMSWTNMISALAVREPGKALLLFNRMRELIPPDCFAFSSVLKACAGLVTDRQSSAIHSQMMKYGFQSDLTPMNALIHAYARSGSVRSAKQVFDEMKHRDTFSWNSVLKAYAIHGRANEAIDLFAKMDRRCRPDGATFVALLSACNHAGMVEEGKKIFDSMIAKFGIEPQLDHFACMVDILGRSGRIAEAEEFIRKMPTKPDSVIWKSMLGACRRYGEIVSANRAMEKLKELDPGNSLGYVVMSNLYSSVGVYGLAGKIRNEMNSLRVRKEPGLSWIEVGNEVHEFGSGGERHPEGAEIRGHAKLLVLKLKDAGYRGEASGICYYDVDEEEREEELLYHSEKLALVFGLMKMIGFSKMAIKINKNIAICVDCHSFMKVASNVVDREIVIRDPNRFHHFRDGHCSCNDYW